MNEPTELIRSAESVAELAVTEGHELLVIGAAALAGHHYVRFTRDLDLAGNLRVEMLKTLAKQLEGLSYQVDLREADAEDPLGGVLDIRGDHGLIQVISFAERFPAVIDDALREATLRIREESPLRIIPLPHLVVLKLYAGGFKSKADIIEVLIRNPEVDLNSIEALCDHYRVPGFKIIREELQR